jgi:hypothetical protein
MLALAYMQLRRQEEAVPVWQDLLKLDPNDAAYYLAGKDLSLPDAQRYAEKAVKSIEDDAAQVRLDRLQVEDLDRMKNLASYWDTLGYVYFHEGDLPRAQRYLEAAWNLEQKRIIGRHLARVYDKEGKAVAATHQQALADAIQDFDEPLTSTPGPGGRTMLTSPGPAREAAMDEVQQMRRTKLGKLSSKSGSAEFFLLIAPSGVVEDIKFISGDEPIHSLSKSVASLKFKTPLPEGESAKLVRRGVLVCEGAALGCDFTLFTVDSVHSTH